MKAAFYTLGCKVNQYDTNAMSKTLEDAGFELTGFDDAADVYIINTCTVTNVADKKSRNMIRRAKKKNPQAIICVCGCLAQKNADELIESLGADIVIGNENRNAIAKIINQYTKDSSVNAVCDISKISDYEELATDSGGERSRGTIKIQEGCNNFCSYCIIPYVRGRVRSRNVGSIINEACRMAENDVKEIVLAGINISSFGQDTGDSLIVLLEELNDVEGILRIRLGSLEMNVIDDAFLGRLSVLGKVCPHFHVSLQSGSDPVLMRMNRHYKTNDYKEAVELIRKYYDRPAITTDIITGFPGETEEEFLQTQRFVEEIRFSRIHVFPYSERAGTKAASMEGAVPVAVRKERAQRLIELGEMLENVYIQGFLGSVQKVLFEEQCEDGYKEGYTDRYMRVRAKISAEYGGVLLKEAKGGIISGNVLIADEPGGTC